MTARKTLSLRASGSTPEQKEKDAGFAIHQALHHLLCLRWTYNRTLMKVEPQVLYSRNDSLYCDAVVIERQGIEPPERKLGSFRLSGLAHVSLTSDAFLPMCDIDLTAERYRAGILARAIDET